MTSLLADNDDHLVGMFCELVGAAGLAPIVCGRIGPHELFENLTKVAPFLTQTFVRPEDGLATVEAPWFDLAWAVFTNGDFSTAIFIMTRFDEDFSSHLIRTVIAPFSEMAKASGLTFSMAARGDVQDAVIESMRGARTVSMASLLLDETYEQQSVQPAAKVEYAELAPPAHLPEPAHLTAPTHLSAPEPATSSVNRAARAVPSGPDPDSGRMLTAGANVPLSPVRTPGVFDIELAWFVREPGVDLDSSAILLDSDGRVCSDAHFVFFNNSRSPDGAVELVEGTRTTSHGYELATISIRLGELDPRVDRVVFVVSIYDSKEREQSFALVPSSYLRVRCRGEKDSQATFLMAHGTAAAETAMVFGEVYRRGDMWKFRAIGQGYDSGLAGIATDYGVNVG